QRALAGAIAEQGGQALRGFADAAVVQLDALDGIGPGTGPVARLEAPARTLGDRGKARVVVGKAVAQQRGGLGGKFAGWAAHAAECSREVAPWTRRSGVARRRAPPIPARGRWAAPRCAARGR